jgi:putative restriction endonuclease
VWIAHTDPNWHRYLASAGAPTASGAVVRDEVNFWSPMAKEAAKNFEPAELVFFRLGKATRRGDAERCIVGYGWYATDEPLDIHTAWDTFGQNNGAPTKAAFARLMRRETAADLDVRSNAMILRNAVFWPRHRYIPWDTDREYARSGVQRGRNDTNPVHVALLTAAVAMDGVQAPQELVDDFRPVELDERRFVVGERVQREGQGTFRLRLLEAYKQCAITGEHTEPVLQASHIQPYLGPASNHVRNGLLLTQEFHTLFDRGLITVEPPGRTDDYVVRVSDRIRERWNNGHRYYRYDGQPLKMPGDRRLAPSVAALEWHRRNRFERGG